MSQREYAVRDWNAFKASAGRLDAESLAHRAIEKWASDEAGGSSSPNRAMREALSASIAGAALVDLAIEKIASEGGYTQHEADFMLQLNAEAALSDIRALTKTASALADVLRSPVTRGALGGAVVGGGIGAWKDDDNRARGALLGAAPGAVIGALGGHAYQGHAKNLMEQGAAKATEAFKATQQAAQQAQQASQSMKDAHRWHRNLQRAADVSGQPGLLSLINAHKDKLIEHAVRNPQTMHPDVLHAAGQDVGMFKKLINEAKFFHSQGE